MGDTSVLSSDVILFRQLEDDFRHVGEVRRGQQQQQQQQVEGRKKKVVVVKKQAEISSTLVPSPTKKIIVARKVHLGDTSFPSSLPPLTKADSTFNQTIIHTNGLPITHTIAPPFEQSDTTIPLSIISRVKRGPKYDADNQVVERTVLGSVDEYLSYSKPVEAPKLTEIIPTKSISVLERPRTAMDADELIDIMKDMSIHEKVRYLKEERALQRWERTVAEWERIKARMASKTGRDIDHLLLSRSECFREVMEQKELIERALATKDHEIMDLFSTTLKPVGPDKDLFMEVRQPSRDPMEVIGKPGATRSRPSSSYYSSRKQELQYSIEALAPYEPDVNELSVTGTPLSRPPGAPSMLLLNPFGEQFYNSSTASLSTYVNPPSTVDGTWVENTPLSTPSASRMRGPMIEFEGATQGSQELRVVCEVKVGGLARSVLHAHNTGSTAVYYSWRKVEKGYTFQMEEEPDTTQRFYFHDIKGVMLPSETHSFTFGFKSAHHGIFFEKWIFESSPALSTPGPTLTLKGIAVQEDDTAEARYQLEEAIGAKQIDHGVQDIIRNIIDSIQPVVKHIPPLDDVDAEQEAFLRQNKELHLYYSTELGKAFHALACTTFEVLEQNNNWDLSVIKLNDAILSVPDERLRSDFLAELNSLIEQASVPKIADTSIYYCMAYDLLVQLADRMPSVSSSLREGMILPPVAFVPAEDDTLRKIDSLGNLIDEKQKMKDGNKRKQGRIKRGSSPDKRQESPPRGKKKEKTKDKEREEESDKADDDRNKSPAKKRQGRTRQREKDPTKDNKEKEKDKDKDKEKEERDKDSEKPTTSKDTSRRLKKKKQEGEEDKRSEGEEEWSDERKAKEVQYKSEFYQQVKGLVTETFMQFRQLAKEADVLTQRVSQDSYFEYVADPSPMEQLLESEFAPPEERGEEQQEETTSIYSFPRTASVLTTTQDAAGEVDAAVAQDARMRRRRRVQSRRL